MRGDCTAPGSQGFSALSVSGRSTSVSDAVKSMCSCSLVSASARSGAEAADACEDKRSLAVAAEAAVIGGDEREAAEEAEAAAAEAEAAAEARMRLSTSASNSSLYPVEVALERADAADGLELIFGLGKRFVRPEETAAAIT